MVILLVLIGLAGITMGCIQLFAPDRSWKMTQWSNNLRGVKSERTPHWEMMNIVSGIFVCLMSFFLIGVALQDQRQHRWDVPQRKEVNFAETGYKRIASHAYTLAHDKASVVFYLYADQTYEEHIQDESGKSFIHQGSWRDDSNVYPYQAKERYLRLKKVILPEARHKGQSWETVPRTDFSLPVSSFKPL